MKKDTEAVLLIDNNKTLKSVTQRNSPEKGKDFLFLNFEKKESNQHIPSFQEHIPNSQYNSRLTGQTNVAKKLTWNNSTENKNPIQQTTASRNNIPNYTQQESFNFRYNHTQPLQKDSSLNFRKPQEERRKETSNMKTKIQEMIPYNMGLFENTYKEKFQVNPNELRKFLTQEETSLFLDNNYTYVFNTYTINHDLNNNSRKDKKQLYEIEGNKQLQQSYYKTDTNKSYSLHIFKDNELREPQKTIEINSFPEERKKEEERRKKLTEKPTGFQFNSKVSSFQDKSSIQLPPENRYEIYEGSASNKKPEKEKSLEELVQELAQIQKNNEDLRQELSILEKKGIKLTSSRKKESMEDKERKIKKIEEQLQNNEKRKEEILKANPQFRNTEFEGLIIPKFCSCGKGVKCRECIEFSNKKDVSCYDIRCEDHFCGTSHFHLRKKGESPIAFKC